MRVCTDLKFPSSQGSQGRTRVSVPVNGKSVQEGPVIRE
jgi:hypothetical protein